LDEMELLEQFCAEQPPPDPRRLQAARDRLTRQMTRRQAGRTGTPRAPGRPARPPRQLRYGLGRYAIAAGIVTATVIGLTVTTAVMTTGPGRPSAGSGPGAANPNTLAGGAASSRPTGRTVLLAAYILHRAAAVALAAPQPRANQYIYTVTRQVPGQPALIQTWQSPDGRRGAVRWTSCPTTRGVLHSCLIKLGNGRGAPIPPDRTYAGLRTLPTSPRALLAYLIRHGTCNATGERLPPAQAAYEEAMMILDTVQALPRRTGAALFDALAAIPGITVIRNVADAAGGHGIAVQMTFQAPYFGLTRHQLIFNRRTYQYIGSQRITVNASHGHGTLLSASDLVTSRIVNSAPVNYTTWTSRSGKKKPIHTGTPSCGA
jgi:hypothetical protein